MTRVRLMDCAIDNLSFGETLERIEELIESRGHHYHVSINVDKLLKVRSDPTLKDAVERADLVSADGQPVVWASRLLGTPLKARVAGIDLMEALIARSVRRGWRLYFLGARPEVVRRVTDRYAREFPDLAIIATGGG